MDVQGRVALVTGASSGIGLALCRLLTARGASVALAARSAGKLDELADELERSVAVPTDVRDDRAVRRMVEATFARFGRIDILVNNAGRGMHTPVETADLGEYRDLFNLNVVGALNAMQQVIPVMAKQGGGVIINVSSGTTLRVLPGVGPYSSTKHALNNLTLVARTELADRNIRVGLVYPFITATGFAAAATAGGAVGSADAAATAGVRRPAATGFEPDTAEYAAGLVLEAIETEQAETFAAKVHRSGNR